MSDKSDTTQLDEHLKQAGGGLLRIDLVIYERALKGDLDAVRMAMAFTTIPLEKRYSFLQYLQTEHSEEFITKMLSLLSSLVIPEVCPNLALIERWREFYGPAFASLGIEYPFVAPPEILVTYAEVTNTLITANYLLGLVTTEHTNGKCTGGTDAPMREWTDEMVMLRMTPASSTPNDGQVSIEQNYF